jgi:hypothetical protein
MYVADKVIKRELGIKCGSKIERKRGPGVEKDNIGERQLSQ